MNLEKIKIELPDAVKYKGKKFIMSFYSRDIFPTKKHPTRSKDIVWDAEDGSQIYLSRDEIEYIPIIRKNIRLIK